MLDLKFIRAEPDAVRAAAAKKRIPCDVDRILELDVEVRARGQRFDELRAEQKATGKAMGKASPQERERIIAQQTELKAELKVLEDEVAALKAELQGHLDRVPNIPADDVPDGVDDSDNVEIKRVGEPTSFAFEPRDHVTLAEGQGWLDTIAGARIAGSRNYILKGDLSLLEGAVMRFALEHMVERGFTPLSVPTLVRTEVMYGTGYFPGGEDQAYRCDERDDLCLVGTAEVPVTALHAEEILPLDQLPRRYVALSSCYRREAGAAGRDTRGLYRVHQFQKVEQVVIDIADAQRSIEHHQAILQNAEAVMIALGLPYRVVNVCGGDLGQPQVQKFDIETWMPSREGYGETHSASRFHDFQARRLMLRYRDGEGKVHFCHTLNNTVAASTRMLIALLENCQLADGRIAVPEPLRPYLRGRAVLGQPL
ncbi:serine--tRNA ligase [Engelhardtia mirabilis]|uniref:Serine--tRNA ligase n=1 Tax=Engelhardtia mirabilis TaxID=2528011 RepID=A0A518BJN0_9BACT|nr:Serine--tRNA ligase [Planctomycetes bacterium Pla133]QDV01516.1 Serine--tRNA ligase [Planctomycetes bacterium Pla86]